MIMLCRGERIEGGLVEFFVHNQASGHTLRAVSITNSSLRHC